MLLRKSGPCLGPKWVRCDYMFRCRSRVPDVKPLLPLSRRGAGAVERGGLENRCPPCGGPRVRIPPSPPEPCPRSAAAIHKRSRKPCDFSPKCPQTSTLAHSDPV